MIVYSSTAILFRRDNVVKSQKVLTSLNEAEQRLVAEVGEQLGRTGCLTAPHVEKVLSGPLFEKLIAAGVYDLNQVTNEQGSHVLCNVSLCLSQIR